MVSLLLHVMMNVIILLCVLSLCLAMPPPPPHSFDHRVHHSDGDKKVFITLNIGPYSFKKRREKGKRVTFTCNGCQKFKHYLPVVAVREQMDSDPENDQYESLGWRTTGVEQMIKQFRKEKAV